jgi:hypothetical protein
MEDAFVGALVGSGLTILAQWFLGPRIDRRVRAHERWEQFLIEFAALIDGPVKRAEDAARSAWVTWHALHEAAAMPDFPRNERRFDEWNEERRRAFRTALDAWEEATIRPEWLARRISGDYGLAETALRRFYSQWVFYVVEQIRWNASSDRPPGDPNDWERPRKARKQLVDEVELLSSRIGVPVGPVQRVGAWRRRRQERRGAANTSEASPS